MSYLHLKQEVFLLLFFFSPWQLWHYMNSFFHFYKLAACCHRSPIIMLHSELHIWQIKHSKNYLQKQSLLQKLLVPMMWHIFLPPSSPPEELWILLGEEISTSNRLKSQYCQTIGQENTTLALFIEFKIFINQQQVHLPSLPQSYKSLLPLTLFFFWPKGMVCN